MTLPEPELPGEVIQKRKRKRIRHRTRLSKRITVTLWASGAILTVALLAALAFFPILPGLPPAVMARNTAQAAVKAHLGNPALSFSPPEWTRVESLPGEKYSVSGWFTTTDPTGKSRSYNYVCKVSHYGNTWVTSAMEVIPQ